MKQYKVLVGKKEKEFFNLKIDLKHFTNIKSKNGLDEKGFYKEYIMNNTCIQVSDKDTRVQEFIETDTIITKNLIIMEGDLTQVDKKDVFYDTDSEFKYILFESDVKDVNDVSEDNNVIIQCKKFHDYFTLSYESTDKNKILKLTKNIY